jgi:hypothetical protein
MKFGMEVIYKTLSTRHEFCENLKSYIHGRNFVINILGEGSGAKSTIGIRNFNLRRSQFRRKWKIGQSQSLINVRPFSPLSHHFQLSLFNSIAEKSVLR